MNKRADGMMSLYKQGQTLQQIGDRYGLTRERVRQIITKHFGRCASIGGNSARAGFKDAARMARRDRESITKYGCSFEQSKFIRSVGAGRKFTEQRRSSVYRAIPWNLTLWQFWRFWIESGKWEQRGRGANKYCMARIADEGGYEIGNIQIITNAENGRLYAVSKLGKSKRPAARQGVCLLYPGWRKPWMAFFKRRRLGYFATEQEAYAARAAAMAQAA